ncbi:spore germination protein [Desulfofundulus thermosubterraneus]|uniref:Spore germination protein KA n=1 Tax=Desulfofundulus thermosubterraneus DSM 16057 TaxID=1121432 RepID=A0A1M6EFL2_9FIRM|nr:spore germination protein [Desulfofundulus thermosubterraneus]SHI84231.1 spore germination protein KA [Desulfofundulus thermosubterraneus DSM 16057]
MRKRVVKKLHHLIRNYAYKAAGKNTGPDDMDWIHQAVVEKYDLERIPIEADLATNIKRLKGISGYCPDFIIRQFEIGGGIGEAAAIFLEGMVERVLLNENLLKPLMIHYRPFKPARGSFLDQILSVALPVDVVKKCVNLHEVIDHVLEGSVVLLVDGESEGLALEAAGFKTRVPEEPMTEAVVRGSREGFTEALHTNITLLRRRLKTPNLVLESMVLGRISHTQVVVGYVRGLAAPELVAEVRERLKRIDIDGILESNYLEELLRDHPLSPFPQAITTERPDRVAANLLEGRVAILTENTPFVLIVPGELVAHMQSPEDFYHHFILGVFIRLLRWCAFAVSLLLPSVYVAVTTFHQEMIPIRLLLNIVAAREGVPFPAVVEALVMEIAFEILREAGVRLPRAVGQAVSIVGALVIGEAAVMAGVVSPLMVIVVALTGISSFLSPSFDLAISIRILRFPMMFLAGLLGLFGVATGMLAVLIHLAGLRSVGLPYLAGLTPFHHDDWKDLFIRAPLWMMRRRPAELSENNRKRQASGLKPEPPDRHPQGGTI